MRILWSPDAWDDYVRMQTDDPEMLRKVNALIKDVRRDPYRGLGKPEPLKANLSGWWSRRITGEHRLVYRIEKGNLEIASVRYHYSR